MVQWTALSSSGGIMSEVQRELEIPRQAVALSVVCECSPRRKRTVYLRPSLDPTIHFGKCFCGKIQSIDTKPKPVQEIKCQTKKRVIRGK